MAVGLLALSGCMEQPRGQPATAPTGDFKLAAREPASDPTDRRFWEAKCVAGNGSTCFLLGGNYQRGGDTPWGFFPQDYARAVEAYDRGCKVGDLDSCAAQAGLMVAGRPVENLQGGARLARDTCERGHARACGLWGMIKALETPGLVAYEEGLNLMERACKQGGAEACSYRRNFVAGGPVEGHAPTSAFGLSLRANRTDAATWCSAHSLQTDSYPNMVMCRTASGWASHAFTFEGETLIGLTAIERAGRHADDWTNVFKAAVRKMTDTYGPPNVLIVKGGTCVNGDELAENACLENGRVELNAGWLWGKRSVGVIVHWDPQAGPLLLVLYTPGPA